MQSGRKSKTVEQKKMAGTVQKCRDATKVLPENVPVHAPAPPSWLSDGAKEVWRVDLPRTMIMGLAEVDQSMFALYCETMSAFVEGVKVGAVPNAAFRSELRKQMELLGIAGAKSRQIKVGTTEAPKASPFSARKKPH